MWRLLIGMSTLTKTIAAVGAVLIAIGAVVGTVLLTRPKAPPPSDSQAAERAARYCVDGLSQAVAAGTAKVRIRGADKVIDAIELGSSGVEVYYSTRPGGNVEHAEYAPATFIVQVVGQYPTPIAKILGETAPPWLRCTEALQYYEQEKAKDVAAGLQNWVWGPAGIEGTYRLSVTQEGCTGLDDCGLIDGDGWSEHQGVHFRVSDCVGDTCAISNVEAVWERVSDLRFDGTSWRATGTETLDFGFYCDDGRARPTAFDMTFQVDRGGAVTGRYVARSTTAQCSEVSESFTVSGARG